MKINRGDGFYDLVVEFESGDSEQLQRIVGVALPKVLNLFATKNRGYAQPKGQDYTLGVRGEFVEVHRKVGKLHRGIWDGDESVFLTETKEEVIGDLIGHLLLMLDASWNQE